ncbi:transforming growth factor beta activator LRRC33 [Rhinophrynus dorsalis]
MRSFSDDMAIASFWLSLGCMYLMFSWRNNFVEGKRSSQTGCKLFHRVADCSHVQLSYVPQDLPIDIEDLLLDSNSIKSLGGNSFLRYHDLTNLRLQSNHLELIEPEAFQGTMRLESLSLQDNTISANYGLASAALRFTKSLKKLDMSGNELTADMVSSLIHNLTSLEYLFLDNNIIMRLDNSVFEGLNHLKELSLQGNYIYEIEVGTFDGLVNLKILNLAYNLLPCIEDFGLTQLQILNLSFNSMEWFQSREIDDEFHLTTLDISNNQLLFFPLLPRHHRLHSLLLSDNNMKFYANLFDATSSTAEFLILGNNITNITTVKLWEETIVGDLSTLHYLDLSRNQFNYFPNGFFAKMTSLLYLKLNWNCIQTFFVSQLEITSALTELDISNNELFELKVNNSQSMLDLIYFNLSNNNLQTFPRHIFRLMKRINTLDLSHNKLHFCSHPANAVGAGDKDCVDVMNVSSLRHLRLSGCGIELHNHNVFYGTALTHLDLSQNKLKGIDPLMDIAKTLQVLSLRNSLHFNVSIDFTAFQRLTTLDISENALTTFPKSLTGLALHSLDLRKNKLISLPLYNTYQQLIRSLKTVHISSNPFDCCELNWLNILNRSCNILDLQQVTCNYSNSYLPVQGLPETMLYICQWKSGGTWLYFLLTVPVCLTLLVALILLVLTFKHSLLQTLKMRCRRSTSY